MPHASHAHEPSSPLAPAAASDAAHELLVFDRAAVREVDQAAIGEYGIAGVVLMENAARGLCEHALNMLPQPPASADVLIICGMGNNGGDAYALARLLHNLRVRITIFSLGLPRADSDAAINRRICERMRLNIIEIDPATRRLPSPPAPRDFALIVDAIFGTGLDRPASGLTKQAIDWINGAERPVLAVDIPSGMDCDSGRPLGTCVKATRTVTFVGLKKGFLELPAQKLLGEVVVADIGAPRELVERLGTRIRLPRRPDAPDRPAPQALRPSRPRD